jgi:hypothetical protein
MYLEGGISSMQTVGINALRANPGILGKALDSGDYLPINRRGTPLRIAATCDGGLLDLGFRK